MNLDMETKDNKKVESSNDFYTLLSTGFRGNVIVEYAPINEKYWNINDIALINKGQIRLGGCWFDFDSRYKVRACA